MRKFRSPWRSVKLSNLNLHLLINHGLFIWFKNTFGRLDWSSNLMFWAFIFARLGLLFLYLRLLNRSFVSLFLLNFKLSFSLHLSFKKYVWRNFLNVHCFKTSFDLSSFKLLISFKIGQQLFNFYEQNLLIFASFGSGHNNHQFPIGTQQAGHSFFWSQTYFSMHSAQNLWRQIFTVVGSLITSRQIGHFNCSTNLLKVSLLKLS